MSIFGDIMGKIFYLGGAQAATAQKPAELAPVAPAAAAPQGNRTASVPQQAADPKPGAGGQQTQAQPAQQVDVEKVLTELAAKKGGGGHWQTSIVDLLKLLDLDSSLAARKQLGQELGVHAGADGSAEQNIALQKAVWAKLAQNGGKVPASLHQ